MAPTSSAISGQLKQLIYYHLDNSAYENALFFSERLAAHDPRSSESVHLLALSHLRLGDYRSSYEFSKAHGYRGIHLGCSFVFAQACLALERYKDGITALEKARSAWAHTSNFGKHGASYRAPQPDTASVSCLLGKLYRAFDDKKRAIMCFEESLKANPFMWDAFTSLSDMGANVRTQHIFKLSESLLQNLEPDLPSRSVLEEHKDSGATNPMEPVVKKASARAPIRDTGDPFEAQRPAVGHDMFTSSNTLSGEGGENEFMAKINAARSRMPASTMRAPEGMETPPSMNVDTTHVTRQSHQQEPAQGAPKKTRNAQAAEPLDVPPKMSYRLGSRRNQRTQEKGHDELLTEANMVSSRTAAPIGTGIERKRTVSGHPVQPRQPSEEPGAPPRRSTRINMFRSSNPKANSGAATVGATATRELKKARPPISRLTRPMSSSGTGVGRVVSGNRKPVDESGMDVDHAEAPRVKELLPQAPAAKTAELDMAKMEEALKYLLDLLKKFSAGYYALSRFQCTNALAAYASLPRPHQETPWVTSQMGRAFYEQANYGEAEKHYRRLRILAPTRLEDMEVYSTILWFLKREIDLCFLAHELVDAAWHSPQAWCALGNAWSLARDHEQALRCFKRATQLNPKFAYAFTLQGHEHVANEEYEKALTAYRQAISADRRHYNAYYGIGRVHEKLGNFDKAYTHFHTASIINPTNAVLICCIGNVLEKQRKTVQALQYFTKATELAPNAAQTRYKKARALLALNELSAAQEELEILKNLAPDEATVHFLLGKLYKSLNDKGSAVRHFTIALNLDPKVGAPAETWLLAWY